MNKPLMDIIMKTKRIKLIVLTILGIFSIAISYNFSIKPSDSFLSNKKVPSLLDSTITGTWISDQDSKWKLIFTNNNKCSQYYDNVLSEIDTVIISNTSPQCGIIVDVDEHTNYLQLKNTADTSDKQCYLINGITNSTLSISVVDEGGTLVFTKQ